MRGLTRKDLHTSINETHRESLLVVALPCGRRDASATKARENILDQISTGKGFNGGFWGRRGRRTKRPPYRASGLGQSRIVSLMQNELKMGVCPSHGSKRTIHIPLITLLSVKVHDHPGAGSSRTHTYRASRARTSIAC